MMMENKSLRKDSLGLWAVIFFVVAAASPLTGIVGALPIAFMAGNGAGVPGVYVIAGLILLVFTFGFVAMSRHVVNAGAFYSYISVGLGRKLGIAGLSLALLAYTAIQLSVVAMFGFFASQFCADHLGLSGPWWAFSGVMLVVVLGLGMGKVELGGRILGSLMLLEIGIALLTVLGVLLTKGVASLDFNSFTPKLALSGSMGIAMIFAISSFVGFEATAIYSEECKEPEKVIPRATILAVILISLFFATTSWGFVEMYGQDHVAQVAAKDPGRFVFNVANSVLGGWAVQLMSLLLVTSLFAATQAFHNTMSRYLFSIARDGFLWGKMARVHPRFHTPYVASMVQTGMMLVLLAGVSLAALDPLEGVFAWCSAIGTMSILSLQGLVSVAVLCFFLRNPHLSGSRWSTRGAPVLAALGMFGALYMVAAHLDVLSGSNSRTIFLLPYLVGGVALLGYALAQYLSWFQPQKYAQLGKIVDSLG